MDDGDPTFAGDLLSVNIPPHQVTVDRERGFTQGNLNLLFQGHHIGFQVQFTAIANDPCHWRDNLGALHTDNGRFPPGDR